MSHVQPALILGIAIVQMAHAAPFVVVSHSAAYDAVTQEVHFTITAASPPDFFTVDEFGRQKDAFQFYLDIDPSQSGNGEPWERIVRGGEIYVNGDLRLRAGYPSAPEGEPSGGWGVIVDTVPFVLDGATITFTYSFAALGTTTGQFNYQVLGVVYGGSTGPMQSGSSQPVPAAGTLTLFAGGVWVRGRRRQDGSRTAPTY